MDRRAVLRSAGMLGAALFAPRALRTQQPDADRLRMPGAVQRRAVVTEAQNDETVKTIERRLKCTCGCNLDIFTCRTTDFTCELSPALHREVVALLEAGNSPDEVVAAFVAKYGEEVLMAPVPEGFNLAGYLVPGAALLVAGGVLVAVIRRRHRVAQAAAAPAGGMGTSDLPASPAGLSTEELAKLEEALQEVDR